MGLNIPLATSRLKSERQEQRKEKKKTDCPSRYLTCNIELFSKDARKWSLLTSEPLREEDGGV